MNDFKFIQSEKKKVQNSSPKTSSTTSAKIMRDPASGLWKKNEEVKIKEPKVDEISIPASQKKETVASLIAKSAVRLAQIGIDTPREDAEILLAFCLKTNRTGLYKLWREEVPSNLQVAFEEAVEKRVQRIPVGYITGKVSFLGLEFLVDQRVMIPRPETELMVQKIIELAKSWKEVTEYLIFADVGVGSGAISISCVYNLNFLKVYAIDISQDILEVARINTAKYHFENSITFLQGNLLEPLPEPAHIIAANLPYITNQEYQMLEPEIIRHEPKEALIGGNDGLWHIRNLLEMAPENLLKGGKIFLEIGEKQAKTVEKISKQHFPFAIVEVIKDLAGKERLVIVHTG